MNIFFRAFVVIGLLAIVGCSSTPVKEPEEMPTTVDAQSTTSPSTIKNTTDSTPPTEENESHSFFYQLILWAPNRILDVVDIVRARVRVGLGVGIGARATKLVSAYAGTYTTVYAGLPGPRGRRIPRLPFGLESYNGAQVGVADLTASGGIGPNYSSTEFEVSIQLILIGIDIGVDPFEIIDFTGGIFFWDPKEDDL
jgi:hypothetical protein